MKQLFGVIGDPIGHSMSPAMHNDAFFHQGISAHYQPFHVKPNELEGAIRKMKVLGVSGFNVTVPHKTTIIPLLDEIDPLAMRIGAVNTVININGKLIGYNTDGLGFLTALKAEFGDTVNKRKTLIIGAGGAARGIYYSLLSEGWNEVDLCNRTIERAEDIIKDCPIYADSKALDIHEAERQLQHYNLIIQTTSIGMSPLNHQSPFELDQINSDAIACDIIYNPLETQFLNCAHKKGAKTQNGIGMFVYQGALAFKTWTGIMPDTERMKKVVLQQLGGTTC